MSPPSRLVRFGPVAAVVAVYGATIALLPRVDVPVGDDWAYARTVERFIHGDGFHILDATVATLVLQALWGAAVTAVTGFSYVTLRLSTVMLAALGAVALYGLCRTLGASREWSAVAAAAWLFNPLAYVLANSFMSDASFAGLLVAATLGYVRGLCREDGREVPRWVVAGSAVAAAAFLFRQQGALIPAAVVAFLAVTGRARLDRAGLRTLLRVAGLPAVTAVAYFLWLRLVHGVPASQAMFAEELGLVWRSGTPRLLAQLLAVMVLYGGLFVAPVAVAALRRLPALVRSFPRRGWWVAGPLAAVAVVGGVGFALADRLMPYVPQYVADWGIGPADIQGGRPPVTGRWLLAVVTVVAGLAAVVAALALGRRVAETRDEGGGGRRPRGARAGAGLVFAVLVGQAVGVLPPTFHFQNPVPGAILTITLDRYLLPLLPLGLALAVWAVVGLRLPAWPAWVATAVLGVVSVAGTHDFLVFQNSTFALAEATVRAGVDPNRLEGGAQWDGERLYQDGVAVPEPVADRPWWVNLFAWNDDSTYVVATVPLPGYVEVRRVPYETWLPPHDQALFLLRRPDAPWPP